MVRAAGPADRADWRWRLSFTFRRARTFCVNWRAPHWIKLSIGGVLTALCGMTFVHFYNGALVPLGPNYEAVGLILEHPHSSLELILFGMLKLAATIFTLGAGGVSAMFVPLFLTGGSFGVAFAQSVAHSPTRALCRCGHGVVYLRGIQDAARGSGLCGRSHRRPRLYHSQPDWGGGCVCGFRRCIGIGRSASARSCQGTRIAGNHGPPGGAGRCWINRRRARRRIEIRGKVRRAAHPAGARPGLGDLSVLRGSQVQPLVWVGAYHFLGCRLYRRAHT